MYFHHSIREWQDLPAIGGASHDAGAAESITIRSSHGMTGFTVPRNFSRLMFLILPPWPISLSVCWFM